MRKKWRKRHHRENQSREQATIHDFIHYCSGASCGEVIGNEERFAKLVRRHAVVYAGKIRYIAATQDDANRFIAKKGWTVAAS